MSLSFYADEHIPLAVCEGLLTRGVDILRSVDDGFRTADDVDIFDRATNLGRIVLTHDRDFLALARQKQERAEFFVGVAYCHQERLSVGKLIEAIEYLCETQESFDTMSTVFHLPLRK